MSSLIIIVIGLVLFSLAYKFYGRRLEVLWQVDPKKPTPAYSKYDSIDYIPAKNWFVLFGHHFASIAGAGPIVGPVIAVMVWGWGPTLIWVLLGTIFIGGVHDFGSLLTSVKEGGLSIAEVAYHAVSSRARLIFSLFVWLSLILVIAVFAWLCANTFTSEPKIVIPSLGIIPVAILVGHLLYNVRANSLLVTLFGLVCLVGLIFIGNVFPVKSTLMLWLVVLFIYSYIASILPVNILLQPRDYISSFLLLLGMGAGYVGLFLSRPEMKMPYFHKFSTSSGYLWPALFITVACGAVSGFHSLIASGTSSKQIANERHSKRIGYGGMLAEGLVAILAIIAAGILFGPKDDLNTALKTLTPIGIFSKGYGVITAKIFGSYGTFIAVTVLNAFILTTLDSATRISRYLTEELFKIKNRFLSTGFIVGVSAFLAISGKWNKIWPAFGASNQLVAALALFVLSCWLLTKGKSIKFTIWPALFMFLTTLVALIFQAVRQIKQNDYILFVISLLLILLACIMIYEIVPVLLGKAKKCKKD